MEEEFVIYPLALSMKELGYDEPCMAWYGSEDIFRISGNYKNSTHTIGYCVSAPTWQSAFAWFREKYKIHHRIDIQDLSENLYDYEILEVLDGFNDTYTGSSFKSYEEAQTACLEKIISIAEKR